MAAQEPAYTEVERLVKNFKNMPASQRRGMNEMQMGLGYIPPVYGLTEEEIKIVKEK